jgi:hypothetical protein
MDSLFPKSRKLVDFRAVFWAGILSGLVFLVVNMLLSLFILGTPWIFVRMVAALVLGQEVLPPPASFDAGIFILAVGIHLLLSLLFTAILAVIIHKWGLAVGIIGGALFGLALYAINFYTFSFFFPWFFSLRSWIILLSHVFYGATAGGLYEALEVERFERLES